jgi:hypothetical protein
MLSHLKRQEAKYVNMWDWSFFRVQGAAVFEARTSIDPQGFERWIGPAVWLEMIHRAVGEGAVECAKASYEKHRELGPSSKNEPSVTESSLLFDSRSDWFRRWLETFMSGVSRANRVTSLVRFGDNSNLLKNDCNPPE